MKKFLSIGLAVCLSLSTAMPVHSANAPSPEGSLVIVGGALESSNSAVYKSFIEHSTLNGDYKIGILPAASSKPVKYANLFEKDLVDLYGLDPEKIEIIPIAVRNDKTTDEIDESLWIDNAYDENLASKMEDYTGIWFLGGDQTRITKALLTEDGGNTPVLDGIWKTYNAGACLGGTSAGAAIMSDVMIAGGDSLGALNKGFKENFESYDEQEHGPVIVSKGLGFFKYGVIDQHFDRKARLGRLIVVNDAYRAEFPVGYGVDENSAMVFDNKTMTIEAVGAGGVTIVDLRNAVKSEALSRPSFENIEMSYIEGHDMYSIQTGEFTVNPEKLDTVGYEYLYVEDPQVTGVLSRNGLYKNLITYDLVDNEAATEVFSYAFDKDGLGYKLRFYQDDKTTGWWGYLDGLLDHYSALNVKLDLTPVQVHIEDASSDQTTDADYVVSQGDVLWKIAKVHKTSVEALIQLNNLENPDLLMVDQILKLK